MRIFFMFVVTVCGFMVACDCPEGQPGQICAIEIPPVNDDQCREVEDPIFCFDGEDNDCDSLVDHADEDCRDVCEPSFGFEVCVDTDPFTQDFCSQEGRCIHQHMDVPYMECFESVWGPCAACESLALESGEFCLIIDNVPQSRPDRDHDGVEDQFDNCPDFPNRDQNDEDSDRVGDPCDINPCHPCIPNACDPPREPICH